MRYAAHADAVLERLAAEHRGTEEVCLVSSDFAVRGTSGQEVQKRLSVRSSATSSASSSEPHGRALRDSLDAETRARLERLRRGEG